MKSVQALKRARHASRIAFFFILLTALASPGFSASILDFFVVDNTGTIAFGGGAGPMVGTGIEIDGIQGSGTPAGPAGPIACDNCILTFQTGNLVGADPTTWTFDTGGVIAIQGSVPDAGIVDELLLGGTFIVEPTTTAIGIPGSPFDFGFTVGIFFDFKHEDLAALYGLPASPWVGSMQFQWVGVANQPGGQFASLNGVTGTVNNQFIPEPATMLLLGVGLIGIARRRQR